MPKIIENVRETILEHARNIVIEKGYDSLTMRAVSSSSGIAVGTVYNYFPTKRDLTIQLMEDYWYDYLKAVDNIDTTHIDFFSKLKSIYNELDTFVETFKEVWVKNSTGEYNQDSITRRKNFVYKVTKRVENIVIDAQQQGRINLLLDSYKTSEFLIQNFFMMAQMKQFDYNDFEKILKKLFQ